MKIYQVGGSVRDKIMGQRPHDIDYAVEAESYLEMWDYIRAHGTIYLETPAFYTIRARLNGVDADFVLCRIESDYKDGRRPEIVKPGTIYDDLARRDFTMNAMAIDMETGELLDPHFGQADIHRHIVKCVGSTAERFAEDGLRPLRAIRFAVTKKFNIDDEIDEYIYDNYAETYLHGVSTDRIKDELFKMFSFSTMDSMYYLNRFFQLRDYIWKYTNIWLEPTMRKP